MSSNEYYVNRKMAGDNQALRSKASKKRDALRPHSIVTSSEIMSQPRNVTEVRTPPVMVKTPRSAKVRVAGRGSRTHAYILCCILYIDALCLALPCSAPCRNLGLRKASPSSMSPMTVVCGSRPKINSPTLSSSPQLSPRSSSANKASETMDHAAGHHRLHQPHRRRHQSRASLRGRSSPTKTSRILSAVFLHHLGLFRVGRTSFAIAGAARTPQRVAVA